MSEQDESNLIAEMQAAASADVRPDDDDLQIEVLDSQEPDTSTAATSSTSDVSAEHIIDRNPGR